MEKNNQKICPIMSGRTQDKPVYCSKNLCEWWMTITREEKGKRVIERDGCSISNIAFDLFLMEK